MNGEKIHSHGHAGIIKEVEDETFSPDKKKKCYPTLCKMRISNLDRLIHGVGDKKFLLVIVAINLKV